MIKLNRTMEIKVKLKKRKRFFNKKKHLFGKACLSCILYLHKGSLAFKFYEKLFKHLYNET